MATQNTANKAHILVVDDDRLILAMIGKGLRKAGYRVSEAGSGEEALRLATEGQPDLALLDVRMPGMSGLEVAEQFRRTHDIPFVFLSAYGDEDIVKQAAQHGALGYLVKPLDITQIVPEIEAALARARDIRALREKESQLTTALEGGRETSMAVGILMERRGLDRKEAFEMLRDYARSHRRRLEDAAAEVINAVETINLPGRPRG